MLVHEDESGVGESQQGTYFSFPIKVCVNDREWTKRQADVEPIPNAGYRPLGARAHSERVQKLDLKG
jgi:hypothetical protein